MNVVFLLVTGSHDDRHVGAAFSTNDRAQSVANAFDHCQVEEYWIDPSAWEVPLGCTAFRVIMRRDGDPLSVSKASLDGSTPAKFYRAEYRLLPIGVENPAWLYALQPEAFKYACSLAPKYLIADIFAREEQHAIEITKQGRDMLIASEQWPTGIRDVKELRRLVAEKFGAENDRDFILRVSQRKGEGLNLEEAKAALLALPGVFRVDARLHISDPTTSAKLTIYTVDPDISHEEMLRAAERVQEIKESLELFLGHSVDIEGYGPRS